MLCFIHSLSIAKSSYHCSSIKTSPGNPHTVVKTRPDQVFLHLLGVFFVFLFFLSYHSSAGSASGLRQTQKTCLSSSGVVLLTFSGSSAVSSSAVRSVVLLARAVDGNLDGNLTAFDFLAVHFLDGLVLQLLGAESDETETTALTGFVTGLELLDHEARNRTQGDLGRDGVVGGKDLLELLLTQVIGQVGHHDLSLGRNTILGRTTLLGLLLSASSTRLALLVRGTVTGGVVGLVGDLGQGVSLTGDVGGSLRAL